MEIIWHGTASIELRAQSGKILFDPFIPLKGSPVTVKIEEFDGFEDIFITHGHFDHVASLPEIYGRNPEVKIYCTQTPYNTLIKKGIPRENLVLLNFGDEVCVQGFKIRLLHGKHSKLPKLTPKRVCGYLTSSARGNIPYLIRENRVCRENGETAFYDIEAEGKSISILGSLNLRKDEQYPTERDLAIMAYNGWKDNLPPAVAIIERLNPKKVFLDHYDNTFPPLTGEIDLAPVLEKYADRVRALERNKVEVI